MKVHVYSIMRNEAAILPYFLRHYGRIADRIFVFDDSSDDGTGEMLGQHPCVTTFQCAKGGIDEQYWTQFVWPCYERYSRGVADWVMCVDADEFVYHPAILDVLKQEQYAGTKLIHCRGYTMVADGPPMGTGQIYDEIKRGLPDRWSCKWVIFDPAIEGLRYKVGRHGKPSAPGAALDKTVCNARTGIRLLHYRYLGPDYYASRDARNVESMERYSPSIARRMKRPVRNLPDDTRGDPLAWFIANKDMATDCVDGGWPA